MIALLLTIGAAQGTEPVSLPPTIVVRVPAPTAGILDREELICMSLSPSLHTAATEFDEGAYGALCESDKHETRACLRVGADAVWPKRFPELVCEGPQHTLRVKFVPGYDPYDSLEDGVRIVRMEGHNLRKTHYAVFAAPELPDAVGILPGGECRVQDGWLTLRFPQSLHTAQHSCTVILPPGHQPAELEVPIRLVDRLRPPR